MSIQAQHVLAEAELAMGSARRVMDQFMFMKRLGWLPHGFSPDAEISRATRQKSVKSLVWC